MENTPVMKILELDYMEYAHLIGMEIEIQKKIFI